MAGAQSVSGARPSNISTTGPTATQEKEPRDRSPWKQGQAATLTKPTEKQEPGPWI